MKYTNNLRRIIIAIITTSLFLVSASSMSPKSPFKGLWRATDLDESNIQLAIAGGGQGIYQLTWTDDYWGICDGLPGIGRGIGYLDSVNPNLLHTDIVVRCTSQHEEHEYQFDAIYFPVTDQMEFQWVLWSRVRK
jgi:hypothetical protein